MKMLRPSMVRMTQISVVIFTFNCSTGIDAKQIAHPPHIVSEDGSQSLSSFIPFCSVAGKFNGKMIGNLSYPACDLFKPTILEGQRCYQLDLRKPLKRGKENGIFFALDTNLERSIWKGKVKTYQIKKDYNTAYTLLSDFPAAKVFIDTLNGYTNFGPGYYALSDVWRMKGTDAFMSLPDKKKDCQVQKFDDCQVDQFLREGETRCGCLPYALDGLSKDQVFNN